jgi:hypothetical protein
MQVRLTLLAVIFATTACFAIDRPALDQPDDSLPTTFTLTLSQDPVFGFYPNVSGSIPITGTYSFTFYGTFWTQELLGGNLGGLNLYTEFGIGLGINLFDGALSIAPSIGISNGNLHSGGGRPVVGDGIVPSLAVNYTAGPFYFTGTSTNWLKLRNESNVTKHIDLYDYSLTAGCTISKRFAAGVYYEHLLQRMDNNCGSCNTTTGFQWVGPFVRITVTKGISVWFAGGIDLVEYRDDNIKSGDKKMHDFYKLSTSIPF